MRRQTYMKTDLPLETHSKVCTVNMSPNIQKYNLWLLDRETTRQTMKFSIIKVLKTLVPD